MSELRRVPRESSPTRAIPVSVGLSRRSAFTPSRRIHAPGFLVFLAIVREEASALTNLDEEDAVVLVRSGPEAVARRWRCSSRTIRRRMNSERCRPKEFVSRVRRRVTLAALTDGVPTSVVATWLGFSSADSYRRWVRTELPDSVRELKRRVREGTEILAASSCPSPEPPQSVAREEREGLRPFGPPSSRRVVRKCREIVAWPA